MKHRSVQSGLIWLCLGGLSVGQVGDARSPTAGRLKSGHLQFLRERISDFDHPQPDRRRAAVVRVAAAGDAGLDPVAAGLASNSNPLFTRSALLLLAEIGTPAAVQRARILVREGGLGEDEQAVLALVLGALPATVPGVPAVAAQSGDELPWLRELAASRRPSLARRSATLALGRLGDESGLRPLLESLDREPLEDRRITVLVAVGASGDRQFLPEVVPFLRDDAPDVRRAAVFVMAETAEPAVLDRLLAAFAREKNERVIEALLLAFGGFDDEESLASLVSRASDRSLPVQIAALVALAARPDGVETLRRALKSTRDPGLLRPLALAAADSGAVLLQPELEELLEHRAAEVRGAAGLALAAQGAVDSRQSILAWLARERDGEARAAALLTVGVLGLSGAEKELESSGQSASLRLLCAEVGRTLAGRRDPRLLRDRLEQLLRRERARRLDRVDALLDGLVAICLGLDSISRRVAVRSGEDSGNEGGGDGGGNEGTHQGPFSNRRASRVDRRNSSVERDLEAWFEDRPYLPRWPERPARQ